MQGTKRFGVPDSNTLINDSPFQSKRLMVGSQFDVHRAEPSRPLDAKRADSSRQHVRALNTQFASWVQTQLQNHPDELWEDGAQDYITHASSIMEKFSDVVSWLKANSAKSENQTLPGYLTTRNKSVLESKDNETKSSPEKPSIAQNVTSSSAATSWGSGGLFSSQGTQKKFVFGSNDNETKSSPEKSSTPQGVFSGSGTPSWGPGGLFNNQVTQNKFVFGGKDNETKSPPEKSSISQSVTGASTTTSWGSGGLFNNQAPFSFGGQSVTPVKHDASKDSTKDDGEDDVEQPSSPSVKKTEEKGVIVVHEVKCKLYVKSSDPAEKDAWKDKGTGQLSIKCKEGVSKGTKDSKPTILVRNDVGRLLLNAMLYPGIKTNMQKNSIVAIFHTSGDGGTDGGNESVVARTFLIRTKNEDDRNKLAAAIQEYAPAV